MGSKLAWLVAVVGAVVFWGSTRGTLWSALSTYAAGGGVDVIPATGFKTQASAAAASSASPSTVILAMPAGSQPPAGVSVS